MGGAGVGGLRGRGFGFGVVIEGLGFEGLGLRG